jgi:hypothetical protein
VPLTGHVWQKPKADEALHRICAPRVSPGA